MGKRTILTAVGIAAFALVASACSIDIERNADGSLQVDGVITESSLAAELERDPLNQSVAVDIQEGFVLVEADRVDPAGGSNAVAFRVDVGVADGHLDVVVSEATFDGFPIPEPLVEHWNGDLARALERAGNRHPDATLLSVDVGGDELAFEWRIETPESRAN
jgi:hypothetical protein